MIAIFIIGLAAGAASALMFASIISGAAISILLFYLAPLPLMVSALGWGSRVRPPLPIGGRSRGSVVGPCREKIVAGETRWQRRSECALGP